MSFLSKTLCVLLALISISATASEEATVEQLNFLVLAEKGSIISTVGLSLPDGSQVIVTMYNVTSSEYLKLIGLYRCIEFFTATMQPLTGGCVRMPFSPS